ncbi:MAG: hypothetical protein IJ588_02800 [Prevotella sp.]|nr:hypothetical protein [Prevotella sp.]
MIKIEYQNPDIEVVKMNVLNIICASDGTNSGLDLPDEKSDEEPLD